MTRALAAGVLLAASLLALFLSSCGGGATVIMKDARFDPDTVTVKRGEEVTWKNEDRRNRQIMSGAPPFMTEQFLSPEMARGDSWSFTFEEAGEFPYHDMRTSALGAVIVEE